MNNFALLNQAVDSFDSRFILRALRSISTLRKASNFAEVILLGIRTAYPKPSNRGRQILEELLPEQHTQNGTSVPNGKDKDSLEEQTNPEIWAYLGVLVQVRTTFER